MSSKAWQFFILSSFSLAVLGFRFFQVYSQPSTISQKEIKFTGRVSQEPVILGQSQYFPVGGYRVRTKIFPKFHYGDYLQIVGTPSENLLISFPEIKKISSKKDLLSPILAFRNFLISKASQIWPQPESALLTGVILGQDSIDANFRQTLINTGTIHIVVVSGQNVSMLAGLTIAVFGRFLRRNLVSILLIFVIGFYTVLTGAQPPTIRAATMGVLAFLAKLTGRENLGFVSLAVAAYLMLFFDPKLLLNISFQLSIAATFGILLAEPVLSWVFKNLPKILKESTSVTISAWIFTAPLTAFYFTQFTLVTPFSNLLVLPVVPFLMVVGGLTLAVSLPSLILAKILAIVTFVPAAYFTFVTENLAQIPFATLKFAQFNIFILFAAYLFILVIILWLRKLKLANN